MAGVDANDFERAASAMPYRFKKGPIISWLYIWQFIRRISTCDCRDLAENKAGPVKEIRIEEFIVGSICLRTTQLNP